MASTQTPLTVPADLTIFKETDLNATKAGVKGSAGTLYGLVIDNSGNAEVTYVKLWDVASANVTVGTTVPDWIFRVAASVKRAVMFPEGVAFATALTAACVTTAGTAGTTNPTADVIVHISYA